MYCYGSNIQYLIYVKVSWRKKLHHQLLMIILVKTTTQRFGSFGKTENSRLGDRPFENGVKKAKEWSH